MLRPQSTNITVHPSFAVIAIGEPITVTPNAESDRFLTPAKSLAPFGTFVALLMSFSLEKLRFRYDSPIEVKSPN
jgi:hypothetical protein